MKRKSNQITIAIAAGGTGGHIFPAIATGTKLKEMVPDGNVFYACGERPLEIGLYEKQGISPVIFPARQLRSGPLGKIMGVFAAGLNVIRAYRWLRLIHADVVVGFGGYVSGPTVLAGWLAGCKTAIHEANSVPGITNKILGRWVDLTASHFEVTLESLGGKNQKAVGMPVRALEKADSVSEARLKLGLNPDEKTLLIMGGSQGARYLYEAIMELLPEINSRLKSPVQVLWSTGDANFENLQSRAEKLNLSNIELKLVPFISDMGNALLSADVAVARAGASAMAELLSFGVYTIYIPYPAAIYDHQTLNALEAQKYGAGLVIKESDVKTLLCDAVEMAFNRARSNGFTLPESLNSTHAAERLAGQILALL